MNKNTHKKIVIAIDGPAAAGKGTLARNLAERFNLAYLDTGTLYRAVALQMLRAGFDPDDKDAASSVSGNLMTALLDDPDLRQESTATAASKVASYQSVRKNLLAFQRDFAAHPPAGKLGALLDGRDIGTVICPGADLKLFVTASPEERARRRFREFAGHKGAPTLDQVIREVKERDARDRDRKDAPLKPADNAHLLDTTDLDIDTVFESAVGLVKAHTPLQ